MRFKVTITGQRRLAQQLQRLNSRIETSARQALRESAEEIRDEARARLDGPAGAGGTAPNSDSGALANSLFVELEDDGLSARVGTDLDYGRHLEFGTSRMAARPWLFPTFEQLKPRIAKRIGGAVRDALKRSGRG